MYTGLTYNIYLENYVFNKTYPYYVRLYNCGYA